MFNQMYSTIDIVYGHLDFLSIQFKIKETLW